jgi:hypothetical protein
VFSGKFVFGKMSFRGNGLRENGLPGNSNMGSTSSRPPSIYTLTPSAAAVKKAMAEKHVRKPKIWKNDTHSVRMA